MKLEEIREIRIAYDEGTVNSLLDSGYSIIKIISSKRPSGMMEAVVPCFVLGRVTKN
jgi:hypothetical protein